LEKDKDENEIRMDPMNGMEWKKSEIGYPNVPRE